MEVEVLLTHQVQVEMVAEVMVLMLVALHLQVQQILVVVLVAEVQMVDQILLVDQE